MNFYLAIDHTSENPQGWTYLKIVSGLNEKLDVRVVRNWIIRHMKEFNNVWCIHIMKRSKKDTYKSIEYVKPDGCSYENKGDECKMGFVFDVLFSENNTIRI